MTAIQPTYYDILGLSPETATDEAVRRVYRTLAYRWHPDRNPQNKAAAENALRMLNEAYMHLKTAPQRRAYDNKLELSYRKLIGSNSQREFASQTRYPVSSQSQKSKSGSRIARLTCVRKHASFEKATSVSFEKATSVAGVSKKTRSPNVREDSLFSLIKEILYPIAPKQTEARRHG
jgi:curved DNA-binding protein CbpA